MKFFILILLGNVLSNDFQKSLASLLQDSFHYHQKTVAEGKNLNVLIMIFFTQKITTTNEALTQ